MGQTLNRGQTETARKYLQQAADTSQTHPGLKEIAAASVRSPGAGKALNGYRIRPACRR